MKLSKSSWHYRLNMWYTWRAPNNLCPYFWRTAWYIIILPITLILFIPRGVMQLVDKDRDWDGLVDEYPLALVIDTGLGILFCMIATFWHWNPGDHDPWLIVFILGCVGWILLALIGIVWIAGEIKDKYGKKERKQRRSSLLGEYLKAKKNKYCPKIEWE